MSKRNLRTVSYYHQGRGWCYRVLGWLDELVLRGNGYSSKSSALKAGYEAAREYVDSKDRSEAAKPKPVPVESGRIERRNRSWRKIK